MPNRYEDDINRHMMMRRNEGLKPSGPTDPMHNPYEGEYKRLSTLGRSLTPDEEEIIRKYEEWKPTGGFPIGGSIGEMPRGGGILDMGE